MVVSLVEKHQGQSNTRRSVFTFVTRTSCDVNCNIYVNRFPTFTEEEYVSNSLVARFLKITLKKCKVVDRKFCLLFFSRFHKEKGASNIQNLKHSPKVEMATTESLYCTHQFWQVYYFQITGILEAIHFNLGNQFAVYAYNNIVSISIVLDLSLRWKITG